jgi:hypothetical protein
VPSLKLDLDQETYERVVDRAVAEARPINRQAEVMLRKAVKLPFPYRRADPKSAA